MGSPPPSFAVLAKIVQLSFSSWLKCCNHTSFAQPEFDKVRDELLGRLRELEEETDWAAEQALRQRLYPAGHPSQSMALGTVGSVEHLRLADARDFYQRYYRPQHLIVSIAGDISPEEALAAGENAFGSWKGEASAAPTSATRMMPSQKTAGAFELKTKRSALVLAGLASPSAVQPDYYPFLILNQILVGAPGGGRLGDRVLAGDAAIYDIEERDDRRNVGAIVCGAGHGRCIRS